jgi:membrane dipeptidase
LQFVSSTTDIRENKSVGRTSVILHSQGVDLIENDVNLLDTFKALGVGVMQLAYNEKNRLGDGAGERTDAGLSVFGLKATERCNQIGIVVDCAHTGSRTSLDAMEVSEKPVVFSHANPKGAFDTACDIKDEQTRSVAATGGLTGIVRYPAFLSAAQQPTLDCFIDHLSYVADLVGIEHVALGIDYFLGQVGVADDAVATKEYEGRIAEGRWRRSDYPPPPYYYSKDIEMPERLPNLTIRLLERGHSETEIRAVLCENWMHVLSACWDAV